MGLTFDVFFLYLEGNDHIFQILRE